MPEIQSKLDSEVFKNTSTIDFKKLTLLSRAERRENEPVNPHHKRFASAMSFTGDTNEATF